jgi:hypothetical protein
VKLPVGKACSRSALKYVTIVMYGSASLTLPGPYALTPPASSQAFLAAAASVVAGCYQEAGPDESVRPQVT